MPYIYNFEKLEVWQLSRKFVAKIYRITEKFPAVEKFGLTVQLRRAAVSVISNIAEGANRKSGKDQARFYQYAYSSIMEILSQLIISVDLNLIKPEQLDELREEIEHISNKLNALHKRARNK